MAKEKYPASIRVKAENYIVTNIWSVPDFWFSWVVTKQFFFSKLSKGDLRYKNELISFADVAQLYWALLSNSCKNFLVYTFI